MPRLSCVTMCSSGRECVWNDELMAISGQNRSTAHWMISCGDFVSNSFESVSISCVDNMPGLYRHKMPEWVKYPKGKVPQGYNADMNSATIARLREINREFYDRFGAQFSATRQRLQPGVKKILNALQGDESILDLGCGNGELARELTKRGHRGAYLGVDFSRSLLREAQSIPGVSFREVDLAQLSAFRGQLSAEGRWAL